MRRASCRGRGALRLARPAPWSGRRSPRRASGAARQRKKKFTVFRLERLEARCLMSVAPLEDVARGAFFGDAQAQQAAFEYVFKGTPTVEQVNDGVVVSLDGEATWVSTGDPVLPVRRSTILLPQGMRITSVAARWLDEGLAIGAGAPLLAAPAALPTDGSLAEIDDWSSWTATVAQSLTAENAVEFVNETIAGYWLGTLRIFPVEYDPVTQALLYHSQIAVTVNVEAASTEGVAPARGTEADRQRIATLVENPDALAGYTSAPSSSGASVGALAQAEYLVITSNALAGSFQTLVNQKIARGLSAAVVTTEYIYANYTGTETRDHADKIRHFIADAYARQGTRWVLLGGDVEVIPARGVYAAVGTIVDNSLPTDLYYACLDGPWNGDGDARWGEANDGAGGGEIDLAPEVYIGRAPVSNPTEAANFVAKTLRYETTAHPNATTALLLGEQLDAQTQGSYSNIPIRDRTIPSTWNVVERYDAAGSQWTAAQLLADLNASPNLVHHLGHANETYNARLYKQNVAALTNEHPYFMYSQGCLSGAFDTYDVSIAEQHVVGPRGALGVVMNSRYGWYIPGTVPGASHNFALSFWDGVFNRGKVHLGEANQFSKQDNRFRVGSTGADRWIYFATNLLGDPETPLQLGTGGPPGARGEIRGAVWNDANADGARQTSEAPVAGQIVYLDSNNNAALDQNVSTVVSTNVPVAIPDNGTAASTLVVSGVARVVDVNVTLDITHTYASDLEAYLVSPAGTRVLLFSRVGGWGRNFTNTTLDDEASAAISGASAPFSGAFRPQGLLSVLDGQDPNGAWTLEVSDRAAWDTGTLNRWSLSFTSQEVWTQTGADGAYAFTGLADGTYRVRTVWPAGWTATAPASNLREVVVQQGSIHQRADFGATTAPPPATDLGRLSYRQVANLDLSQGAAWYRLQTSRQGYLTIEALAGAGVSVRLYDAACQQLAASTATAQGQRIDTLVAAGQTYYISVTGSAVSAGLRLANLVRRDGATVLVEGTDADDRFEFAAGAQHRFRINGVEYAFDAAELSAVDVRLAGGNDAAVLTGSAGDDAAELRPARAALLGPGYRVDVAGAETVVVSGGGGSDTASLFDSAGDDAFHTSPDFAVLSGAGYHNRVNGFAFVYGYASAGLDTAHLFDSTGDDALVATPQYARLFGNGFFVRARGFDAVHAYATAGGYDTATFYDSTGHDTLVATPQYAKLYGAGFFLRAKFFEAVQASATGGGYDRAFLYGSEGDDVFTGTSTSSSLAGKGFYHRANFFDAVYAYGGGGYDQGFLYDSAGNDRLDAAGSRAWMTYPAAAIQLRDFGYLRATSSRGGNDLKRIAAINFLLEAPARWADA